MGHFFEINVLLYIEVNVNLLNFYEHLRLLMTTNTILFNQDVQKTKPESLGRLVFGALADLPFISAVALNSFSFALSGMACLSFTMCSRNLHFQMAGGFYGVAMSGFCALTTTMLVELGGLESLTFNMGLLVLLRGVTSSFGPPLGGLISERLGSYNFTYIFIGAYLCTAGIIGECAHIINRKRKKK